jgi:hypothetical protein
MKLWNTENIYKVTHCRSSWNLRPAVTAFMTAGAATQLLAQWPWGRCHRTPGPHSRMTHLFCLEHTFQVSVLCSKRVLKGLCNCVGSSFKHWHYFNSRWVISGSCSCRNPSRRLILPQVQCQWQGLSSLFRKWVTENRDGRLLLSVFFGRKLLFLSFF